jgi:hypothetical protein
MLTQSAPAVFKALSGVLPDAAIQALVQAVGNCNQPLAHRGPISLSPGHLRESGPGYMQGGRWNPQDYSSLLPTQESARGVDVPGWDSPGGWGSSNYYGDTFNFPTNQEFSISQYYGGPNVYNAGDQYTDNSYSNTVNTTNVNTKNINVTKINGRPIAGPGGPQGQRGERGERGLDGAAGPGFVVFPNLNVQKANVRGLEGQGSVELTPQMFQWTTASIPTYTGATIDEDCNISLSEGEPIVVLATLQSVDKANVVGLEPIFTTVVTNVSLR